MKKLIISIFIVGIVIFPLSSQSQSDPIFPEAEITPDSITFDDTRVGQTSATQTFTVTKTESVLPLIVFGAQLADTVNFTIVSDGCAGKTLHSWQECEIDVAFNPTERATFETTITLLSISKEIVDHAKMKGRGVAPAVTLSTTSIDFGDETVGTPSAPYEVVLVNSGTEKLTISSIAAGGEFGQSNDCGTEVAAGGSCNIDITFTPTATGAASGTVTITDDASDSPQTIALQGNGVPPGTPDLGLSRHSIDFGGVPVGTPSAAEDVVVTNVGTVNVNITSITADSDYTQTNDCPATLAPDATCTVDVVLQPSAAGVIQGTLVITSNASDSPQTVTLTGRGLGPDEPYLEPSPTDLNFGTQPVSTKSNAQTLTLQSTGTADVSGISSAVEGNDPHSFSTTDRCSGLSIPIGESCTIDVFFTPAADGTFEATLVITSDAVDSPTSITITGIGSGQETGGGGCALVGGDFNSWMPVLLGLVLAMGTVLAVRVRRMV